MREEADASGRAEAERADVRRPRPRPRPVPSRRVDGSQRRLGRFFAVGTSEPDTPPGTTPAGQFPGVPSPEQLAAEAAAATPRPRPGPAAAPRPRPGTEG